MRGAMFHVNTAESSDALIRRGLIGIYHNVSREFSLAKKKLEKIGPTPEGRLNRQP
jgi:hypothetical protein